MSTVTYEVGQATHVGHVRERNEDSHRVLALGNGSWFVVVADGVGGHPGGDVASGMAVGKLGEIAEGWDLSAEAPQLVEVMKRALARAHEGIERHSSSTPGLKRMATTVVCALLLPTCVLHMYCGDSRLYWWRGDDLYHTRDHTALAGDDEQSHIISSYLGGGKPWPWVTVSPQDHERLIVRPDDVLLLCTDGLNGLVSNPDIQRILQGAESAQHAADSLVTAALDAGGHDNVTAVVIRVS